MLNNMLIFFGDHFATNFFACSQLAGEKVFKKKQFIVIENAINFDEFKFNKSQRKEVRGRYDIDNKTVLGNVGRLAKVKNQIFLLDLIEKLNKESEQYVLIIVGNGPEEASLRREAKKRKISESIIIINEAKKISELYNSFDIFVMPSKYEGLGLTAIEAQVNGLPCILSEKIPKEASISDSVQYLPIAKKHTWLWIDAIKNLNDDRYEQGSLNQNFNLKNMTNKVERLFMEMELKNE